MNHNTVARARKATVSSETVERKPLIGKDGKARKPRRKRITLVETEESVESELDENPENFRVAFLLRVEQASRAAVYSGPVTKEIVSAARAVADAWSALARKLEKSI